MRAWPLLAVFLLWGCQLPEDVLTLSGQLVDGDGRALAAAPVTLWRDASLDGVRCLPMTQVAQALTDADGGYRFELLRQQITLGRARGRYFKVQAPPEDAGTTMSVTFPHPLVDLTLPALPTRALGGPYRPNGTWVTETEASVDGALAWRSSWSVGPVEDRETALLTVTRRWAPITIDTDAFGSTAELPLMYREEGAPWMQAGAARPVSRGAACDVGPAEGPCPLTDGRFLPVRLPPETKTIAFTLPTDISSGRLTLHGLSVAGTPAALRLEVTYDTSDAWARFLTVPIPGTAAQEAASSCLEPGMFLDLNVRVLNLRPRRMRIHFLDADKAVLPISQLQEVSIWES